MRISLVAKEVDASPIRYRYEVKMWVRMVRITLLSMLVVFIHYEKTIGISGLFS